MPFKILVINPGGTGIKASIFEDQSEVCDFVIKYPSSEIGELINQRGQLADEILKGLKDKGIQYDQLGAIISRGAPFYPLQFGVYPINEVMVSDLLALKVQTPHVSMVAPLVANEIGKVLQIPCYMADPISVEQGFLPEARITGRPGIERRCLFHALNIRFVATEVAKKLGANLLEFNFVVAHLGTGFSICALAGGNILDVNNANDGGPFSPQRAGTLPITALVSLCEKQMKEGKTGKEIISVLIKNSGLLAHLGNDNLTEIEEKIKNGDKKADLIIRAMAYQIGKEIGAMSATLKGKIDGIIITGGCAHSNYLINLIKPWMEWISPHIYIMPGEGEMEALAAAVLRVLKGEEETKNYIGWDKFYAEKAQN